MTFAKYNSLIVILIVAVVLRLGLLWGNIQVNPSYFHIDLALMQEQINSPDQPYHNGFGSEISNVAYSIVKGQGFSSPFGGRTGPTGWVAPGMVAIYAMAFYLFGPFSFGSVLSLFLLSVLLSLATVLLVYSVALKIFDHRPSALAGSLLYALSPHDLLVFYKTSQQDFNFFPFLFILNLFVFLTFYQQRTARNLVCFSLVAAVTALFNPVFLAPLTMCIIFPLFCNREQRLQAAVQIAAGILIIVVFLGSYSIYQKQRLGVWTLVKSNGIYELYQGNVPDFNGILTMELFHKYHPIKNINEYQRYRTLGETEYIASKRSLFLEQFELTRFLSLSARRFTAFYFVFPALKHATPLHYLLYALRGLGLVLYLMLRFRRMKPLEMLVVSYILVYSLPYCLVGVMYRYSFPIVPLTMMLLARAVFLIKDALKKKGAI